MDKEALRIIYMGTPEFAVESLRRLVEGGYNVVGVVTMPDKAVGRHHDTLSQSEVKKYALSQGLKVMQPERLRDEAFLEELRALRADLQIVVAFRMLPEVVWDMPRLGTFNLHASLLPQYRGAAPINWAVINGEEETGVTTFFLQHDIDTGNIIAQRRTPIGEDENVGDVYDRLMHMGGDLVVETVDAILRGDVQTQPQAELCEGVALRPAPKIFKDTCRIPWHAGVKRCHDFVRGLSPYPGAWTELLTQGTTSEPHTIKIYKARPAKNLRVPDGQAASGSLWKGGPTQDGLFVTLPDGVLEILELQMAGKRRMSAADFLRGYRFEGSECLA
ncbi:MAG: methionyl-tRNA formyltransferase [Alloprevotella sp.]|nr:methionyl-tRNA formyltransferase [Alloprevotella sp.]